MPSENYFDLLFHIHLRKIMAIVSFVSGGQMKEISTLKPKKTLKYRKMDFASVSSQLLLLKQRCEFLKARQLIETELQMHVHGLEQKAGTMAKSLFAQRSLDAAVLLCEHAYLSMKIRQPDDAVASVLRAVSLQPLLPQVRMVEAKVLYLTGDLLGARQAVEKIVSLNAAADASPALHSADNNQEGTTVPKPQELQSSFSLSDAFECLQGSEKLRETVAQLHQRCRAEDAFHTSINVDLLETYPLEELPFESDWEPNLCTVCAADLSVLTSSISGPISLASFLRDVSTPILKLCGELHKEGTRWWNMSNASIVRVAFNLPAVLLVIDSLLYRLVMHTADDQTLPRGINLSDIAKTLATSLFLMCDDVDCSLLAVHLLTWEKGAVFLGRPKGPRLSMTADMLEFFGQILKKECFSLYHSQKARSSALRQSTRSAEMFLRDIGMAPATLSSTDLLLLSDFLSSQSTSMELVVDLPLFAGASLLPLNATLFSMYAGDVVQNFFDAQHRRKPHQQQRENDEEGRPSTVNGEVNEEASEQQETLSASPLLVQQKKITQSTSLLPSILVLDSDSALEAFACTFAAIYSEYKRKAKMGDAKRLLSNFLAVFVPAEVHTHFQKSAESFFVMKGVEY